MREQSSARFGVAEAVYAKEQKRAKRDSDGGEGGGEAGMEKGIATGHWTHEGRELQGPTLTDSSPIPSRHSHVWFVYTFTRPGVSEVFQC